MSVHASDLCRPSGPLDDQFPVPSFIAPGMPSICEELEIAKLGQPAVCSFHTILRAEPCSPHCPAQIGAASGCWEVLDELRGEQRRTAESRGEAFMLAHHDLTERISGLVIVVHKRLN